MHPDFEQHPGRTPPVRFEERLLSRILADYDDLTSAPPRRGWFTSRRHRESRRAVVAIAVPCLAAVAIAAVVLLSSRGSNRGAGTVLAPRAQNTAYVVDRVRANLGRLAVAGTGRVLERSITVGRGGDGDPAVENTDWAYIDPRTKVSYQRSVDRSPNGTVLSIAKLVTTPLGNDLHTQVTFLDPTRRAYDVISNAPPSGTVTAARSDTALGITSTAHQIARALRSSRVTRQGTAIIDGQPTIELSVPPSPDMVRVGLPARTRITLDVDLLDYEPVQEKEIIPGEHGSAPATNISRWLPTTRATIALAKVRIPSHDRRMSGPVSEFWTAAKPLFFIGY